VIGRDLLDAAGDLDVSTETHGDIDVGAMVATPNARIGVSLKHATEPEFDAVDGPFVLKRQARAGLALLAGRHGVLDGVTVAFDMDLTKTETATGEAQHLAAGVEGWFLQRRLGLRSGISHNRREPSGTGASAGISIAARSRLYLDGAFTFGSDETREGWDVSLRVTF
jgi:hypothetical protein